VKFNREAELEGDFDPSAGSIASTTTLTGEPMTLTWRNLQELLSQEVDPTVATQLRIALGVKSR
jgi:hypothetical protein